MLNSIVLGHEIIMFRGGGHADSNRNCDDRLGKSFKGKYYNYNYIGYLARDY